MCESFGMNLLAFSISIAIGASMLWGVVAFTRGMFAWRDERRAVRRFYKEASAVQGMPLSTAMWPDEVGGKK